MYRGQILQVRGMYRGHTLHVRGMSRGQTSHVTDIYSVFFGSDRSPRCQDVIRPSVRDFMLKRVKKGPKQSSREGLKKGPKERAQERP